MSLSIIASGAAGFAVSCGLGQGATLVAAFWGVFIWKEFNNRWQATLSPIRSVRRRACSLSSSTFAGCGEETRVSCNCAALDGLETGMGANFGRRRDSAIPGRCFSWVGHTALRSVMGK
jgi:hypothetical protein